MDNDLFERLKESMESFSEEEKKCTECLQYGRVNHRGVCEFCEDPYGISPLMELVELEESILRGQE